MAGPHCDTCSKYESRVMAANGGPVPADLKPCDAFAMSDGFREWLVGQMRKEVLAQISTAGLDRMAIVKAPAKSNGAATAGGPHAGKGADAAAKGDDDGKADGRGAGGNGRSSRHG